VATAVDIGARARLIEEHLPLVRSIARRYARRTESLDDLVQVGAIGLIKAVDRFDPARGRPLAALAAPTIEGEIRHHLRDNAGAGTSPAAGLPAVGDIADGADPIAHGEAHVLLASGWHVLDERERRALELRFFADLTQAEIATRMGLSQAHVSRLIAGALERLRTELTGDVADAPDRPYSQSGMATPEVQPEVEPEERPTHSGRLLVRMPQSLHAELAHTAEREGVSLNTLIIGALSAAVGWRDGASEKDERPDPSPAPLEASRWPSIALAANFAIVAIAGVLAIVLLIVAFAGG
jgi:RNA polymerase sigma-B factor